MMEATVNIKFCLKTGKTPTKNFHLIKQAYCDNTLSRTWISEWYLNGLIDLKVFRVIQGAGVFRPLEMKTQSQMSAKWWCEIIDGLSEWWRVNETSIRRRFFSSSWRFAEKEDLSEVRLTQTHGWTEAMETHITPRLQADLSRQSQFPLLHFSLSKSENCPRRKEVSGCRRH
jgi:hypothetical protein